MPDKEITSKVHDFLGRPSYISVMYNNVITNDVSCAPFVTTLLKRSGEAKIDIALVHLCDFLHCVSALLDRRLCDKIGLNKGTWYIVFSIDM